ncbi:MAG: hypothetical protein AAFQ94_15720 [Bacteroidota bacterium]
MKNFFTVLLLIPVLFSCSDNEPTANIFPIAAENSVNLSNPQVGQKSTYVRYTTNCANFENDVLFTGDTITLSVELGSAGLMFKETFSPNSPMLINSQLPQEISYRYQLKDGYSLIQERISSQLFFFYGNDTLFLDRQDKTFLQQENCRFFLDPNQVFIGEEIGHFDDFKVGQITVTDKDAVSCIPMILNMEGYLIYDKQHLSMSHTMALDEITGWLQIE